MSVNLWVLIIGSLLVVMALANPIVERLPITPTIIYLFAGIALGPWGVNAINLDPFRHSEWLLHASEVAVVISLFTVGMKLRLPWHDRRFRPAFCLASVSMVLTVALITLAGVWVLGLSVGAAVLLGAILAPTDPVLASEVRVQHPKDRDKIRLTLSTEAGLNDGTAFPFVVLGLGLLQHHALGTGTWRWWTVDVIWSTLGGLTIGSATGYGLGRLLLHLQTTQKRAVAFGEYLVLGLIGVSYSVALFAHAGGFLAVFASGVALRAVEMKTSRSEKAVDETRTAAISGQSSDELAANPRTASAYFAGVLLATNELLEHLLAVGVVMLVGALLAPAGFASEIVWFAPLLFLVIRPLSALPLLFTGTFSRFEFGAVSWFGIRGIGSVYYLMYALQQDLDQALAHRLASLTLSVVAVSILVHGVSVTPLFSDRNKKRRSRELRSER